MISALAQAGWLRYASPRPFHRLAGRMIPGFAIAAILFVMPGIQIALFVAPTDAVRGDVYRIMFVHVPAVWMSMLLYVPMAACAGFGLVLNARLCTMMARAIAPTGALFAALALVTGALWRRAACGAWWVWDARLTSGLILLFLYLGFMSLHGAIADNRRADRACAVLALGGVVNIPVICFSAQWWRTSHQDASMLAGMLAMTLALWCYAIAIVLVRIRRIIDEHES